MELKVLKNVPIPPKGGGWIEGLTAKLRTLEIGDCVVLEGIEVKKARQRASSAMDCARQGVGGQNRHLRYTQRTVDGIVHIWRVS